MCLAVPLKIIEIIADRSEGVVDMEGATATVGLDLVPEAQVGDFVLVHAGMAIQRLEPDEAEETLALYREFAASQEKLEPEERE